MVEPSTKSPGVLVDVASLVAPRTIVAPTDVAISGSPRIATTPRSDRLWIAWTIFGLCSVAAVLLLALVIWNIVSTGFTVWTLTGIAWGPCFFSCSIVAMLILRRHPHHRVGWTLAWAGLVWLVCQSTYAIAAFGMNPVNGEFSVMGYRLQSMDIPRPDVVAQLGFFYPIALYLLLVELLLVFPSGQLTSPGWIWARILGIAGAVGASYDVGFGSPFVMNGEFGPLPNPFHLVTVPGFISKWLGSGFFVIFAMGVPAAIAMSLRLLQSSGAEREQLKWIAWNTCFVVCAYCTHIVVVTNGIYGWQYGWFLNLVWGLALQSIPIAVGIAILRYRLYDIDVVIRRTVLYSILTGAVIGLYLILANGFLFILNRIGGLEHRNAITSAAVTVVIVFLFQPLRDWLQRAVIRVFFGDRDAPDTVLNQLGARLEASLAAGDVLPMVVTVASDALKIPYVAITLRGSNGELRTAAETGQPLVAPARFPMVYQGEMLGELLVSPRSAEESFSRADRTILESLARQAAVAAHALRLTNDLQLARQRLVNAREDERLRLRRDLHDGLGAQLAALAIQAGGIRHLVKTDSTRADTEIGELQLELRRSIGDIRSLVHGMRPPALDELGLVGALRARILAFQTSIDESSSLTIDFAAPVDLSPLPAAVEVAIYRVAEEALTNMSRHSRASRGHVSLAVDHDVRLTIDDNGRGMPEALTGGIGLASMRERAAELGGTLRLEPCAPRGTRLTMVLPLATFVP
jgi:signal transduction histidine kinase